MVLCPGLTGWAGTRRNTHPPSWSSSNLYQLLPSTTIHSILLVQITAWQSFCITSFHVLFGLPLGLEPSPHIPYISSPNQCLLFAAHAHTIATCFAVVSILYNLFLVFFSTPYLELLSFTLTLHMHLTILISLCSLKCHLIFFPDRPGLTSLVY